MSRCAHCGAPFERHRGGAEQRFCSEHCRALSRRQKLGTDNDMVDALREILGKAPLYALETASAVCADWLPEVPLRARSALGSR